MIPAVLAHADRCTELYWQVGARQLVVDLLLLTGDLTLAAVPAPDQASTEESKALQWAVRLSAEAATGGVTAPTSAAVAALLAAEARLPALEALVLWQAWAAGRPAGQGQGAVDVEARRQALVASLGDAWGQRSPAGVLAASPVLAR